MIIYPAIDLKGGQCVRLYKGDMAQDTVYNDNPAAQAYDWSRLGFSWVHIVDLDGAIAGESKNHESVKAIINAVDIPVQLGGGIRTYDDIKRWLDEGVSRVILGTVAVKDPDLVFKACNDFPGQIAVGLDARDDRVAVEGWVDETDMSIFDLAKEYEHAGVAAIIYTDINRDGTGEGINLARTTELAKETNIPVIASGGVGSIDDLRGLKAASAEGVAGVIIGKALYEGNINPAAALEIMAGDPLL